MSKYLHILPWILFPVAMLIVMEIPTTSLDDPLWEIVHTPNSSATIMRTPVPHGWLVTYKSLARSIVYVPDEKHEWKLTKTDK